MAPLRLPPATSVLATVELGSDRQARAQVAPHEAAPAVGRYKIIRTNEVDAKDEALTAQQVRRIQSTGAAALTRSTGDNFEGTARKAAKLSIADTPAQDFESVAAVIATLPSQTAMTHHHPGISDGSSSERVAEEQRNVRLSAFLYAASRENDNDFHLIVGDSLQAGEEVYMTMEVSGLPPPDDASFAKLKSARDSFQGFFGDQTPGASYDFYDPPIPILVEGSPFFDISHAHGRSPGPPTLHPHMPVIWEIHPVASIQFEPGPNA